MKITKRTREQAALICAIQASTPDLVGYSPTVAQYLDAPDAAAELAWQARHRHGLPIASEGYAEAAQLLLEGWSP
jgi:hypothetical protein